MAMKKITFNDILRVVNKSSGHGLSARLDSLRKRHDSRLKELGVRPLNRRPSGPREYSDRYDDIYHHAFEALKRSNRSWATEGEIKDILYGNKQLSRERSAEVVEIMRRAGVPGFKETDEVTPGDVYSERVLNVIKRQQTAGQGADMHAIIDKVSEHDARNIGMPPEKTNHTNDSAGGSTMRPVRLESNYQREESTPNSSTEKRFDPYEHHNETPRNKQQLSETNSKDSSPQSSPEPEENDVPLTQDLDDPDL